MSGKKKEVQSKVVTVFVSEKKKEIISDAMVELNMSESQYGRMAIDVQLKKDGFIK